MRLDYLPRRGGRIRALLRCGFTCGKKTVSVAFEMRLAQPSSDPPSQRRETGPQDSRSGAGTACVAIVSAERDVFKLVQPFDVVTIGAGLAVSVYYLAKPTVKLLRARRLVQRWNDWQPTEDETINQANWEIRKDDLMGYMRTQQDTIDGIFTLALQVMLFLATLRILAYLIPAQIAEMLPVMAFIDSLAMVSVAKRVFTIFQ